MADATARADDAPFAIYRRLLRYAAPHWAMFIIGVIGMTLFAASDRRSRG